MTEPNPKCVDVCPCGCVYPECADEVNDSGHEINVSAHEVNGPSESGVASIDLGGRKLTWSDVTVTIGGREILSVAG